MLKKKLEIINETAEYYGADTSRRGVDRGHITGTVSCKYYTDDGKMCAVGRCLIDASQVRDSVTIAAHLFFSSGYGILKPEYRIEDASFWRDLQNFHDNTHNWDENGLTEFGKTKLHILRTTYAIT
jgi:hypothetical protein